MVLLIEGRKGWPTVQVGRMVDQHSFHLSPWFELSFSTIHQNQFWRCIWAKHSITCWTHYPDIWWDTLRLIGTVEFLQFLNLWLVDQIRPDPYYQQCGCAYRFSNRSIAWEGLVTSVICDIFWKSLSQIDVGILSKFIGFFSSRKYNGWEVRFWIIKIINEYNKCI